MQNSEKMVILGTTPEMRKNSTFGKNIFYAKKWKKGLLIAPLAIKIEKNSLNQNAFWDKSHVDL